MLPECIILAVTAVYVASVIDFRDEKLKRVVKSDTEAASPAINIVAGLVAAGALIYDAVEVFSHLQNAETGEFDITGLAAANWTAFIAVTVSAVVVTVLLLVVNKALKKGKAA